MNETKVDSTTLLTVAYDGVGEMLRLEFRSRAIYRYYGVPAVLHESLLEAASKGGCFHRVNRGRFPCVLTASAQDGLSAGEA